MASVHLTSIDMRCTPTGRHTHRTHVPVRAGGWNTIVDLRRYRAPRQTWYSRIDAQSTWPRPRCGFHTPSIDKPRTCAAHGSARGVPRCPPIDTHAAARAAASGDATAIRDCSLEKAKATAMATPVRPASTSPNPLASRR